MIFCQMQICTDYKIIKHPFRIASALWFCAVAFCLLLTSNAVGSDTTNNPVDLVVFFKNAVGSPPEIEHYIVKRTQLQFPIGQKIGDAKSSNSFQYLEGSFSGTNFFLHHLPDPGQPVDTNHLGLISARAGSSVYEIGGHGIIKGTGTNGLTDDVKAQFSVSRQVLGMGVGEIASGTIKWSGNSFTATNVVGKGVHGSLIVSNNLPVRMEIALDGSPMPYASIEYAYPASENQFSGYPEKFLICYKSKDGLKPLAEVEFKSLVLATQHLGADFFSETRFANCYRYTNMYSNSDYYVSDSKSNYLVKANSLVDSGGFSNTKPRAIIYICLFFVTFLPLAFLLNWLVRQNKTEKGRQHRSFIF
jgi:hypothetical protein